ncbi:MAG: S-layer homology domain-containing protein [Bryobacteraceae bacterium]
MSRIALLVMIGSLAWGQTITRIAGTGTSGFSGDGGQALAAQFASPRAVGLDANGNLIFVDHGNDRVRKITAAGVVSTIAGTGDIFKDAPDNSAATSTFFWRPSSVVISPSGVIYIADTLRDVVRRINGNGTATIVAGTQNALSDTNGSGGPATQAKLSWPRGLALDNEGNLYIADSLNHVVRKVTPSGTILNVAGVWKEEGFNGNNIPATTAKLNGPIDVAVDGGGNLYIAEGSANRVRKVSATGIISAYAGTGEFGFAGDGGAAVSAKLSWVEYIAVDRGGNLYISDQTNNRIRKVTPNGTINTIAGTGALGNSGDGGNALSATFGGLGDILPLPNGDLYVVDNGNHVLRKITYNCDYSYTPEVTYVDAAGGTGAGTVNASAGCLWAPFSDSTWLTTTGYQTGSGAVPFQAAANQTGYERSGFIYAGSAQSQVLQRATQRVYSDVNPSAVYFDAVSVLQSMGIPGGTATNPARYFPDDAMTRAQMAVFIVRAIYGGSDNFTFLGTPYFNDVPSTHPQFKWIQKLRELGVTSGTSVNPPLFSPDWAVNRYQMAKFLVSMVYPEGHDFGMPAVRYFDDVAPDHAFYRWIQELRQIGVTLGTSFAPPLFAPDPNVSRGQMALFILRAINPLFLPAGTPYLSSVSVLGTGESLTIAVSGQNTHFDATSVLNMGADITVNSIQLISTQHLLANITVSPTARKGPRPVVVRTGSEDAFKLSAFTVQ